MTIALSHVKTAQVMRPRLAFSLRPLSSLPGSGPRTRDVRGKRGEPTATAWCGWEHTGRPPNIAGRPGDPAGYQRRCDRALTAPRAGMDGFGSADMACRRGHDGILSSVVWPPGRGWPTRSLEWRAVVKGCVARRHGAPARGRGERGRGFADLRQSMHARWVVVGLPTLSRPHGQERGDETSPPAPPLWENAGWQEETWLHVHARHD